MFNGLIYLIEDFVAELRNPEFRQGFFRRVLAQACFTLSGAMVFPFYAFVATLMTGGLIGMGAPVVVSGILPLLPAAFLCCRLNPACSNNPFVFLALFALGSIGVHPLAHILRAKFGWSLEYATVVLFYALAACCIGKMATRKDRPTLQDSIPFGAWAMQLARGGRKFFAEVNGVAFTMGTLVVTTTAASLVLWFIFRSEHAFIFGAFVAVALLVCGETSPPAAEDEPRKKPDLDDPIED